MKRVRRNLRWIFRRRLCFGGLLGALLLFAVSTSPSLLPRGWLFQGVVSGASMVIGYGIGSAVSAIARRFDPPEPTEAHKRWFWWSLGAAALVVVPLSMWWGNTWNQNTRELMGMTDLEIWAWGPILLLGVFIAAFILVVSRVVRLAARLLIRFVNRWLPRRWSMAIGVTVIALVVAGIVNGLIVDVVFDGINSAYSLSDRDTTPGFVQPTSELRSGSDASLVDWDDLGTKGRDFTGEGGGSKKDAGPTAADIETFTGEPALEPIRVYVGLRSADSLDARVDLAIQELERTKAFEREIVVVYATTGTGWVDERVADSLEYIWGGNTAAVGMQYSYLPSWVSLLVDQRTAADAGSAMIEAVVEWVEELPEDRRPRVFVFGESLGSFATEAAFDDLDDMAATIDGALLAGPTFVNDLRNEFTDNRDEGSPAWLPVYEAGRRVRFAVAPEDFSEPAGPWEDPHIAYLQNSSDPISHFSIDLLWSKPDWLDNPRAADANPDMRWFPVVTFWQVAADLTYSFGAPAGHGHRYGANVVDGWLAVSTPDGWTDDATQRLRDIVGHE